MQFDFAYGGDSTVSNGVDRTAMSFAPDTLREPTFFRGNLRKPLAFRQAISALHDVVVSDLRWKPKDRTEYLRWRETQDAADLAEIAARRKETARRIKEIRDELAKLDGKSLLRQKPYIDAKQAYFKYLLERDYQAWIVLDPVVTVHPDQVFFECFSKDESSYGRLAVNYDVFEDVGEFACGTTNIDYSEALYDEFQKIRSYKTTTFAIDPSGFEVATTGGVGAQGGQDRLARHLGARVPPGQLGDGAAGPDVPAAPDGHPQHLPGAPPPQGAGRPAGAALLPRAGRPVRVLFEPWGYEVACPRSVYEGDVADEVRVWGRRRLHTLERLVPVARSFTVHLLGKGMPSFYVADLGDLSYTLGLSGWTRNDWSGAGNFDLLAPRAEVDDLTKRRVFDALARAGRRPPTSCPASSTSTDRWSSGRWPLTPRPAGRFTTWRSGATGSAS